MHGGVSQATAPKKAKKRQVLSTDFVLDERKEWYLVIRRRASPAMNCGVRAYEKAVVIIMLAQFCAESLDGQVVAMANVNLTDAYALGACVEEHRYAKFVGRSFGAEAEGFVHAEARTIAS